MGLQGSEVSRDDAPKASLNEQCHGEREHDRSVSHISSYDCAVQGQQQHRHHLGHREPQQSPVEHVTPFPSIPSSFRVARRPSDRPVPRATGKNSLRIRCPGRVLCCRARVQVRGPVLNAVPQGVGKEGSGCCAGTLQSSPPASRGVQDSLPEVRESESCASAAALRGSQADRSSSCRIHNCGPLISRLLIPDL